MLEFLDTILARVRAGEAVALCTLVRARGSTPQAAGAAMAVLADGRTLGTLGGGCVEAEVRGRALKALLAGAGDSLAPFKLDHDFGWDDGLICGGMMDVAVQVLRTPADTAALERVRDALGRQLSADYVITVPDEAGAAQTFVVPFAPRPTLIIAGGGHVGQAIATLAHAIDFDAVVIDDRPDAVSEARFPNARRIVGPIDAELRRISIDAHTFVVIVTRGHRNDAGALAAVIRSPAAYVGMIGSKRKVRTILGGLLDEGAPRESLYRVHAPIGLEVGAITPAEIAVSVAAELIATRRRCVEGRGTELKLPRVELDRWLDRERQIRPDATDERPHTDFT